MEQTVRVSRVYDDGTAAVCHLRQSACSGDCHHCSGCGAAPERMILRVQNPLGAKPGDVVTISSKSGSVLQAAAVLYMLPVILFFAGYALAELGWSRGALGGGLGFVGGMCLAVVYDRQVAGKQKNEYTITGFAGESAGRSEEKGDNKFD